MKKAEISKDDILLAGRELLAKEGTGAISMRTLAKHCGIAVGSVYNYFPSKNDLLIALIDAIWKEIMQDIKGLSVCCGFAENVEKLFYSVKKGGEKYPDFLSNHAMMLSKSGKEKGWWAMQQHFESVKIWLLHSLQADKGVKCGYFSAKCRQEDFIEFVFGNLIFLWNQKQESCDILLAVIKAAIYR